MVSSYVNFVVSVTKCKSIVMDSYFCAKFFDAAKGLQGGKYEQFQIRVVLKKFISV